MSWSTRSFHIGLYLKVGLLDIGCLRIDDGSLWMSLWKP